MEIQYPPSILPAPPGSANLLMLERIGETLAGRAVYVTLWPFTRRERQGLGRTGTWSELLAATWVSSSPKSIGS